MSLDEFLREAAFCNNGVNTIVLKLSGKLLTDEKKINETAQEIYDAYGEQLSSEGKLSSLGIVPGAGPQLGKMLAAHGFEKKLVDGVRYTTPEMMEHVERVTTSISEQLEAELKNRFLSDVSYNSHWVVCKDMGPRYGGSVGMPYALMPYSGQELNPETMVLADKVLIIPSIARTVGKPGLFNVNADHMAGFVAARFNACAYLAVSEEAGVLKDVNDKQSVIPRLTMSELVELLKTDPSGGMIPRLQGMAHFLNTTDGSRAFISSSLDLNSILEKSSPSTEIVRG